MANMPAALENPEAATPPGVIALQRHYGNGRCGDYCSAKLTLRLPRALRLQLAEI